MSHALLWLESLATMLLVVAAMVALAGRRGGRLMACLVVGVISLGLAAVVFLPFFVITLGFRLKHHVLAMPVAYTGSLLATYVAGSAALLLIGAHRRGDAPPRAATWPAGRLALCALGGALLFVTTFWNADTAVRAQVAALRSELGALALSIIPPQVPDDRNAALVYEQAFELVPGRPEQSPVGAKQMPPRLEQAWGEGGRFDLTALADPEVAAYLERQAPLLELARRAAAMPDCWFDKDWGRPTITKSMKELWYLRELARLLGADARRQGRQGRFAEAAADLRAMQGIVRHTLQSPALISLLVAAAIDTLADRALEDVLAVRGADRALAELPWGERVSLYRALPRAMRMEEALAMSVYLDLGGDDAASRWNQVTDLEGGAMPLQVGGVGRALMGFYRVYLLSDDLAAYREYMDACENALERPYPEAREALAASTRQLERRGPLVAGMIAPALQGGVTRVVIGEARHRLARTALALARYRLEQGKYPQSVAELAPKYLLSALLDPFDGQPLRLKQSGEGVVVYSVGPDLKDDGGAGFVEKERTGDLTFGLVGAGK